MLWLYLQERTNIFKDEIKLLHFAPEDSLKEKFLKLKNIKYITTDFFNSSVDIYSDIQQLPFRPNMFDAIICSHVLEHIPDDRKGMREIFRVLKNGGWAILQVPINYELEKTFEDSSIKSPSEKLKFFGQHDHFRIYGRDYPERLHDSGFKVKEENFIDSIPQELVKRFGLMENEIIYVAIKD